MKGFLCLLLCLIWHCVSVQGFNPTRSSRVILRRQSLLRVQSSTDDDSNSNSGGGFKAGQGFGKKKAEPSPETTSESKTTETMTGTEAAAMMKTPETKRLYETPRARREAELDDKIRRLKEEEDLLATDSSVGAVPELVANRMITRIALLAGRYLAINQSSITDSYHYTLFHDCLRTLVVSPISSFLSLCFVRCPSIWWFSYFCRCFFLFEEVRCGHSAVYYCLCNTTSVCLGFGWDYIWNFISIMG